MTEIQRLTAPIRKHAAVLVFGFCLLVLFVFVSKGYRSFLGPVIGGVVGSLGAIVVLRYVAESGGGERVSGPPDIRISVAVSCLYVVSVIVMYRVVTYERPLVLYLMFGGFAGYIAYQIATGGQRVRVVPQLLVLTFFTYWSSQFTFPAGMSAPDTGGQLIPAVERAVSEGALFEPSTYLGHLIYVAESAIVTGLPAGLSYLLLSVCLLTGTLLIISSVNVVLPAISTRVALYGALIFGCMSWTLRRGLHPHKMNFFYALVLLLGLTAFGLYRANDRKPAWTFIGLFTAAAIILGHRFSAGAAMVFLSAIGGFSLLGHYVLRSEYISPPSSSAALYASAYVVVMLGTPIHSGSLLRRFVGIIVSTFTASGADGGTGRYSSIALDLLLMNTSSQAFLFALGVFGAAVAIRRRDWEYDAGVFWLGTLALLLLVSLVFNTRDVQPQRFYSLLGLFGLNIFAGVGLVYLVRSDIQLFTPRTIGVVVFAFAVLSLASPIAGIHLSPFGDQIPHNQKYDMRQSVQGEHWVDRYVAKESSLLEMHELPVYSGRGDAVAFNASEVSPGNRYVFDTERARTGVPISSGSGLGDRRYRFIHLNTDPSDDLVYSNGRTDVYVSRRSG